jgi:dephospho-CoA kinase
MIVVGLTGSIGMGKSTAAKMLQAMGVPLHDSDKIVHELIAPQGRAIPALAKIFPEAYDAGANAVDRAVIGQIVFQNEEKRKALEAVLHPMVRESQQKFLEREKARGARVAVLDIPLLYETGAEKRVDKVIVVTAPAFIQRRRVMKRPGMTESKFQGILQSQMPDHEKRARADFIVQTGLGEAHTQRTLKKIIESLSR